MIQLKAGSAGVTPAVFGVPPKTFPDTASGGSSRASCGKEAVGETPTTATGDGRAPLLFPFGGFRSTHGTSFRLTFSLLARLSFA
jgi:hypothetical protein